MFARAPLLLTLCLLGSCAIVQEVVDDCSTSLCGCPRDHTITVEITLSTGNFEPIPNAALICLDSGETLGITSSTGLISLGVPGDSSPGCGFIADCKVAYFRTKERGFERPFWFHRVIRGTNDDATDRRIEVVINGD